MEHEGRLAAEESWQSLSGDIEQMWEGACSRLRYTSQILLTDPPRLKPNLSIVHTRPTFKKNSHRCVVTAIGMSIQRTAVIVRYISRHRDSDRLALHFNLCRCITRNQKWTGTFQSRQYFSISPQGAVDVVSVSERNSCPSTIILHAVDRSITAQRRAEYNLCQFRATWRKKPAAADIHQAQRQQDRGNNRIKRLFSSS
ncbi:hypothetical protein C4J93_0619 [Pseudomonas sp. R2-37-08W]|nr:hypothetical protein C4J93_0619 [Pseudomonas sp. R2-37-08W]